MEIKSSARIAPNYNMTSEAYKEFIKNCSFLEPNVPRIQVFKDSECLNRIVYIGKTIFENYISNILSDIQDIQTGIASLDIPSDECMSPSANTFWGVAATLSVCGNIFSPIKEPLNGTPFSIHNASQENERKLAEAGLEHHSPDNVLGFHNDGVLCSRGKVFVPENLMLYNIMIAYANSGNFHWVPFSLWDEKKYFSEKVGVGRKYKTSLTPIVYPGPDGTLDIRGFSEIRAPVFSKSDNGNDIIFLNGKITEDDSGSVAPCIELIESLQRSISNNSTRFSAEQLPRRAIFLNNSNGCHARDIFEGPFYGSKYTRSFLRCLDTNGTYLDVS